MPRRTPCRGRLGSWLPPLYQTGRGSQATHRSRGAAVQAPRALSSDQARQTAPRRSSVIMTEITDRDPTPDGESDWLIADDPAPDVVASPPAGRRTALAAVGMIAAGALVGAVGVTALRSHSSDTTASPAGFVAAQVPGGQAVPGQGVPGQGLPGQGQGGFTGGGGGVGGGHGLGGTVTAVGGSSVTIRTASGTTAYGVTAQTEIVRNGALASLSAVRAGDNVFVHLIPGSGSSYVVERLFAQSGSGASSDDDSSGSST